MGNGKDQILKEFHGEMLGEGNAFKQEGLTSMFKKVLRYHSWKQGGNLERGGWDDDKQEKSSGLEPLG